MTDLPPTPTLSATVMLLRDRRSRLEVFMVERHRRVDFTTNALVFPGGKVDEADASPQVVGSSRGLEGLEGGEVAARIAAVRETFEECGVLLARPRGSESLIDASRLQKVEASYREQLRTGGTTLEPLIEAEDLELACDLLVPFAHWITPVMMPRRYDTFFFLVEAPPDQLALHDGAESVDSIWATPEDALQAGREGRRRVIFPTRLNLEKLGRSHDVATAIQSARQDTLVTVLPQVQKGADGKQALHIPPEAGYEITSAPLDDIL